MQATLRLQHRATYAECLAVEQASEHRHELIDGVIVARPAAPTTLAVDEIHSGALDSAGRSLLR